MIMVEHKKTKQEGESKFFLGLNIFLWDSSLVEDIN